MHSRVFGRAISPFRESDARLARARAREEAKYYFLFFLAFDMIPMGENEFDGVGH